MWHRKGRQHPLNFPFLSEVLSQDTAHVFACDLKGMEEGVEA